jgi:hypothetical protein
VVSAWPIAGREDPTGTVVFGLRDSAALLTWAVLCRCSNAMAVTPGTTAWEELGGWTYWSVSRSGTRTPCPSEHIVYHGVTRRTVFQCSRSAVIESRARVDMKAWRDAPDGHVPLGLRIPPAVIEPSVRGR